MLVFSLRKKLLFAYTAVVSVSLFAFALQTYLSVSGRINQNADIALRRVCDDVAGFLDNISKIAPSVDYKDTISHKQLKYYFLDELAERLYERVLKKPIPYYIQIAGREGNILWKSPNLGESRLPVGKACPPEYEHGIADLRHSYDSIPEYIHFEKGVDSAFAWIPFRQSNTRIFMKSLNGNLITAAIPLDRVEEAKWQLLRMFYVAVPFVLVLSFAVGWWLTKMSLQPIEMIIRKVNEINSFDMKSRLPVTGSGDEIDRLSSTLNNVLNRLEKSFRQVKRFTSDASHELRTPLTIMRGELELALQKRKSAEEYEYIIASSLEEVNRLTNVAETLLELSKADSGQVTLDFSESNISNIIRDIAEDAEILASEKKISVCTDIMPDIHIKIDPVRIYQAVLNIVDNAIKYTPASGQIGIALKSNVSSVSIIIHDSGIGISRDKLPHIFDRFYRIDESRSAEVKGLGLGLSISQWIVSAHNGSIDVKSRPGSGSEFNIYLPFRKNSFLE